MKLLSDACEYAIRAVIWMAQRPGQAHKVRQIAEGTHSAPGYLIKVMQQLSKAGILSAQRGSSGGFRLERDPSTLQVLEVINAVDPVDRIETCPLGLKSHGPLLCPMHKKIDDAMAMIEESFRSTTITDLISQPSQPQPLCDALTIRKT